MAAHDLRLPGGVGSAQRLPKLAAQPLRNRAVRAGCLSHGKTLSA
jgi:hypothetical protein